MAEEKAPNSPLQEGYDHRSVSQVFGETLQKGYNSQPLVQTFTELAQDETPATPPASQTTSSPSALPVAASEGKG